MREQSGLMALSMKRPILKGFLTVLKALQVVALYLLNTKWGNEIPGG